MAFDDQLVNPNNAILPTQQPQYVPVINIPVVQKFYDEQEMQDKEDEAVDDSRKPRGTMDWIFDVLNRGQYASVGFWDRVITGKNTPLENIIDGAVTAGRELVHPNERLSFTDIIKKTNPDFYQNHPIWSTGIGTVLDITADPTTWLSFGTNKAARLVGEQALSKDGIQLFKKLTGSFIKGELDDVYKAHIEKFIPQTKREQLFEMVAKAEQIGGEFMDEVARTIPDETIPQRIARVLGRPAKANASGKLEYDLGFTRAFQNLIGKPAKGNVPIQDLEINKARQIVRNEYMRLQKHGVFLDNLLEFLPPSLQRRIGKSFISDTQKKLDTLIVDRIRKVFSPEEKKMFNSLAKQLGIKDPSFSALLSQRVGGRFVPKKTGAIQQAEQVLSGLRSLADDPQTFLLKGNAAYGEYHKYLTQQGPLELAEGAREFSRNFIQDLISSGKKELLDKGGIKMFGASIIPGAVIAEPVKKVLDFARKTSGLGKVLETIEHSKTIEAVHDFFGTIFNRNYKLPKEYIGLRESLEAATGHLQGQLNGDILSMFKDTAPDRWQNIGRAMANVEDLTVIHGQKVGRAITDGEAGRIFKRALADDVKAGRLTDKEVELIRRVHRNFQEVGQHLFEAGLIKEVQKNYFPHIYKVIKDPKYAQQYIAGLSHFLPSGLSRKFPTFRDAEAAGYEAEYDVVAAYAAKMFEARRTMVRKEFKDQIKSVFGKFDKNNTVHQKIMKDIRFIGEASFPRGMSVGTNAALRLYDKFLGMFKTLATTARPSFGAKQLISNTLQSYSEAGIRGLNVFDPTSAKPAMAMILHNAGVLDDEQVGAMMKEFVMRSDFGDAWKWEDLMTLTNEHNIMRGSNIGAETFTKTARDMLKSRATIKRMVGEGNVGLGKAITEATRYMAWPSHVEDFSRLNLFFQSLKQGIDPVEASKRVTNALFDYQHGLSKVEQQILKRIIPFYSFQRFAIPLVARTMIHDPGRIANIGKVTQAFFTAAGSLYDGKPLSAEERQALPGYLLEKHSTALVGSELKGTGLEHIFKYADNFNFIDSMAMAEPDANGDLDIRRTLEKGVLAGVVPALKMPLEWLFDRNFFTGKPISTEGMNLRGGKIGGKMDEEQLFQSLAGAVGGFIANAAQVPELGIATASGGTVAGIFKVLTPEQRKLITEGVKHVSGWETGIDKYTGKEVTYVNPWKLWAATTMIPSLTTVIRTANEDFTPTERVLDLISSVRTARVNVKAAQTAQMKSTKYQILELRREMKEAFKLGRTDIAEDRAKELQDILKEIYKRRKTREKETELPVIPNAGVPQPQ